MGDNDVMAHRDASQFLQRADPQSSSSQGPKGQQVAVQPMCQGDGFHGCAQLSKPDGEIQRKYLRSSTIAVGYHLQDVE
jgi:hypothetical protein